MYKIYDKLVHEKNRKQKEYLTIYYSMKNIKSIQPELKHFRSLVANATAAEGEKEEFAEIQNDQYYRLNGQRHSFNL